MIVKVPATVDGLPAIRQLISEGIDVLLLGDAALPLTGVKKLGIQT